MYRPATIAHSPPFASFSTDRTRLRLHLRPLTSPPPPPHTSGLAMGDLGPLFVLFSVCFSFFVRFSFFSRTGPASSLTSCGPHGIRDRVYPHRPGSRWVTSSPLIRLYELVRFSLLFLSCFFFSFSFVAVDRSPPSSSRFESSVFLRYPSSSSRLAR